MLPNHVSPTFAFHAPAFGFNSAYDAAVKDWQGAKRLDDGLLTGGAVVLSRRLQPPAVVEFIDIRLKGKIPAGPFRAPLLAARASAQALWDKLVADGDEYDIDKVATASAAAWHVMAKALYEMAKVEETDTLVRKTLAAEAEVALAAMDAAVTIDEKLNETSMWRATFQVLADSLRQVVIGITGIDPGDATNALGGENDPAGKGVPLVVWGAGVLVIIAILPTAGSALGAVFAAYANKRKKPKTTPDATVA